MYVCKESVQCMYEMQENVIDSHVVSCNEDQAQGTGLLFGREDAVLRPLSKASKSRQDTSIAKGSKERSAPKEMFPLLKRENNKEVQAVDLDKLLAQVLSTSNPAGSSTGLNTLISLELLKAIKGKSRTNRTNMLAQEDEDTPSSSDDAQEDIKPSSPVPGRPSEITDMATR